MSLHIEADIHIDAEIFQFGLKQWTRHTRESNKTACDLQSMLLTSSHRTYQ